MEINRKRVARRLVSGLVAGALALGGLAISGGSVSAQTPSTLTTDRLGGENRYETATEIARRWIEAKSLTATGPTNLIFASGEKAADALAAASLAGVKDAPILLVTKDSVPMAVSDFLADWGAKVRANNGTMYILGGEGAISADVETALKATINPASDLVPQTFKRLAGDDRYATAQKIMDEFGVTSNSDRVILVGGDDNSWADAISAGPLAADQGWPIIPVPSSGLSGTSKAMVDKYALLSASINQYIIIGGPSAVPSSVDEYLISTLSVPVSNVRRIAGPDRYSTNLAVNLELFTNYNSSGSIANSGWNAASMALATGESPWDALAAAPLAGDTSAANDIHVVLTNSSSLNPNAATLIGAAAAKANGPSTVYMLGGRTATPSALAAAATATAQSVNLTSTLSGCVEGATKVTVTFSKAINSTEVGYLNAATALTVNNVAQASSAAVAKTQVLESAIGSSVTLATTSALTAGQTVAFLGLLDSGNASKARAIAGSTCTVANDAEGPTAQIIAPLGGSTFFIKTSEPVASLAADALAAAALANAAVDVAKLDAGDITVTSGEATLATAKVVTANATGTLFRVEQFAADGTTAVAVKAGQTISLDLAGFKDLASPANAGVGTVTYTVGSAATTDATAPTGTMSVVCEQEDFTGEALASASWGSLKIEASDEVGTTGNGWKIYVVNQRGLLTPSISADSTAKSITVTADTGYHTVADLQTSAANLGFSSWTITTSASAVGVTDKLSATLPAGVTTLGGNQACVATIAASEYLDIAGTSVTTVTVANAAASPSESAQGTLLYVDGTTGTGVTVSNEAVLIHFITNYSGTVTVTAVLDDPQGQSATRIISA